MMTTDSKTASPRLSRAQVAGRALIAVAAGLAALVSLIQAVTTLTGRTLLTFGGADGSLSLTHLEQVIYAQPADGSAVHLSEADLAFRVLSALPSVLQAITFVAAAVALLPILKAVSSGSPFAPTVLRNWRRVALALVGGGVLQGLADTAAVVYLSTHLGLLGAVPLSPAERAEFLGGQYSVVSVDIPHWPIMTILAGIIAFTLMLAFRAGSRLERDAVGIV
jgi:hypothetical protein